MDSFTAFKNSGSPYKLHRKFLAVNFKTVIVLFHDIDIQHINK